MTVTACKCRYAHPIFALPESQWGERIKAIPEKCGELECDERERGCHAVCQEYARVMFVRGKVVKRLKEQNRRFAA